MRAIWSGAITFGLVNIPVRLFSASESRPLKFHFLHKKDLSPIRFARVCREDGHEVPFDDLVRGFEIEKGRYVVLTEKDFLRANARKTRAIEIVDFTQRAEIDPIYFEKPYYLAPDKGAEHAYALLREALKQSGKVGIAKFVMKNREHVAALDPEGDLIVLNQLRFDDEVRKPEGLKVPKAARPDKKELRMALSLIDALTKKFDATDYRDTYTEDLERVIDDKAKGKPIKAKGRAPRPTKVDDLMEVLRRSLEEKGPGKRAA